MNYFLWAIFAACIWGVVPVLEKLGLARVAPLTGLFFRSLGVLLGLIFLSVVCIRPQEIKTVPLRSMFLLIAGGFLASFVAQICFYQGLKAGEVSRVVPIAGSFPLIAFILGVLFLGESINLAKIAGMVLIVAGIWIIKIG